MKEVKRLGKLDSNSNQRQIVYDDNFNSPTLQAAMGIGGGNTPMIVKQIGNVLPTEKRDNPNQGRVYDLENLSPCINTMQGGGRQPMIIQETISTKGKNIDVASIILAGYERSNMTGFNADNGVMETVKIKQATKKGYVECEVGGVADLSYVSSTTRRGRVQDNGQVSPTLTVADIEGIKRIEKVGQISSEGSQCGTVVSDNGLMGTLSAGTHGYGNNHILSQYRIRKLTPKECWRLMGFTDEEFDKAAAVNSNTQLYKQAGNSIVVDVLVAIFSEMINSLEDKTPKYQHMEQMSLFDYE